MRCINPIKVKDNNGTEWEVPCGNCILCLERRVKDWSIRLVNESKYYKKACFCTLTFDNKLLMNSKSKMHKYIKQFEPDPASFLWNINNSKIYFQKFIKRLRKRLGKKIKFFKVGEYGSLKKRPHYHLILFGENFDFDRKVAEVSQKGYKQYRSETLEELWSAGRCRISDLNPKTVAYTVGYNLKKMKTDYNQETFRKNYIRKKYIGYETQYVEKNGIIIPKKVPVTKEKWEYRYKPTFSFSNRGKFNKWIRKHAEALLNDFLIDEDGKKYAIPKAYINELKKSENPKHIKYLHIWEDRIDKYINELDENIEKQINNNKAKILKSKLKTEKRADL